MQSFPSRLCAESFHVVWLFDLTISESIDLRFRLIPFHSVGFSNCSITKGIQLSNARFSGSLHLTKSKVDGEVDASSVRIDGELNLTRSRFLGCVSLEDGSITGQLRMDQARFEKGLNLDYATIGGSIVALAGNRDRLRRFEAKHPISMRGCKIEKNVRLEQALVWCGGVEVSAETAYSIDAKGANIAGSLDLVNSVIGGAIRIDEATVHGDVRFSRSTLFSANFSSRSGPRHGCRALLGRDVVVGGSLRLGPDCQFDGKVDLRGSTVDGDLDLRSSEFSAHATLRGETQPDALAVDLGFTRVHGITFLRNWEPMDENEFATPSRQFRVRGLLSLRMAHSDMISDRKDEWPPSLELNGFEYRDFSTNSQTGSVDRIAWLSRQPKIVAQPYTFLAEIYRRRGRHYDETQLLIERERQLQKLRRRTLVEAAGSRDHVRSLLSFLDWLGHVALGWVVGHGYRPFYAGLWAVGAVLLFSGVFEYAHAIGYISSAAERKDSCGEFSGLLYSSETFLPLLRLGYADCWVIARWVPIAKLIEALFGWVLAAFFVAGVSGVTRR